MWRTTDRSTSIAWLVVLLLGGPGVAADRSYPIDCLADRVASFDPVAANPLALFGAAFVPGALLGPPGESAAFDGSFSVASLGFGGSVVLAFDDVVIEDGPGDDFIVFENPFFRLPLPATVEDDFRIFAEPARVEVSTDGEQWFEFPFDASVLQAFDELAAGGDIDRELYLLLQGLAGLTPTFTGNWSRPNAPGSFDPDGTAGVSGAGGDAFDLADVGLAEARFVRITDAGTQAGFPGSGEGFDLDALVVLHGRPTAPTAPDADGDRLSDLEESSLYGSDPLLADSDLDGVDDGREVASCRDPDSDGDHAWLHDEPRLWVLGRECTELRWSFMGSGRVYDVVRGELGAIEEHAAAVDLGLLQCLVADNLNVRWSCDAERPDPGQGFFYLARVAGGGNWGRSSNLVEREAVATCP